MPVKDFRFHLEEDTYVVWVAGINRYLQLKKPAFHVFSQWVQGVPEKDIVNSCTLNYSLPEIESARFVKEIATEVQLLFDVVRKESGGQSAGTHPVQNPDYFSEHTYEIGNHFFRFIYRDSYLKDLFHPLFYHQEIKSHTASGTIFEIWSTVNTDAYRVNDSEISYFPVEEIDNFQGAVFMEILNAIHVKSKKDWMGVMHASAVTDGRSAVIFAAPSGSGKSSVALLMMANGFNILSDDFVPVALNSPEIYHFPACISVKKSAFHFLADYIPQLNSLNQETAHETELYLPPATETGLLANVPAKAIVFVKYDPETEYDLKRESNLEVMNQLIEQSWIAGTPEAAQRFMDWYFRLPVYSLRYSDNRKAIKGIAELFK